MKMKTKTGGSYMMKGRFPHAIKPGNGPNRKRYSENKSNEHPVMRKINSFDSDYNISSKETANNSKIIAKWDDGDILGAELVDLFYFLIFVSLIFYIFIFYFLFFIDFLFVFKSVLEKEK